MDAVDIHKFLKALNIFNTDERHNWINCGCPLAPWFHKGGTDNNPSFGIKINPIGTSVYKCWSCGHTGDLSSLLQLMRYKDKKAGTNKPFNWKIATQLVNKEDDLADNFIFEPQDYEDVEEHSSMVEFPTTWLKSFIPGTAHPYLTARGVSEEVAKLYDFRFDISDGRVCLPIKDWGGTLYGMQGRDIRPNPKLPYRYYLYQGQSNNCMWMGEYQADPNTILFLCEGMFDLLSIRRVYPNVIASMTSALSPEKLERLNDCVQVISFYDHGTGGDSARKSLNKYFKSSDKLLGHCYPTEEEGDPGNMTPHRIYEEIKSVLPWFVFK